MLKWQLTGTPGTPVNPGSPTSPYVIQQKCTYGIVKSLKGNLFKLYFIYLKLVDTFLFNLLRYYTAPKSKLI